jgi:hypothetical protein
MSTDDSGSGVREVKVAALFRIYVLDRERERTRFLTVAASMRRLVAVKGKPFERR